MVSKCVPQPQADIHTINCQPGVLQHLSGIELATAESKNTCVCVYFRILSLLWFHLLVYPVLVNGPNCGYMCCQQLGQRHLEDHWSLDGSWIYHTFTWSNKYFLSLDKAWVLKVHNTFWLQARAQINLVFPTWPTNIILINIWKLDTIFWGGSDILFVLWICLLIHNSILYYFLLLTALSPTRTHLTSTWRGCSVPSILWKRFWNSFIRLRI